MGPAAVAGYLWGALGYALPAAALALGAAWLLGARPGWGRAALALSTAFVVALALTPLPGPGALDCAGGGTAIRLQLFGFLEAPRRLWEAGAPPAAWLTDLTITSTIMNVVFFALVGAALATQTRHRAPVLLFACALTAFIETAQLTGLFGLYPCRYRSFDVDDLLLNVVGVLLGAALMRWARHRS